MGVANQPEAPTTDKQPTKPIKPPATIRSFWPRYRNRAVWLIILTQIVVALVIVFALVFTGVVQHFDVLVIVLVIAIFAAATGFNLFLFSQLSLPLKHLANAVTQISGEPTVSTPPNPNAPINATLGLTPLLQQLYSMSSNATPIPQQSPEATAAINTTISTALESSPLGVVLMDAKQSIIFSNSHAPVKTNTENQKVLSLVYDDANTVEAWIASCEASAVHAEHVWQRVANKVNGLEDRKIYDIFASYHKGADIQVVLTFLDRSAEYGPEDEALDFVAFAAHELRGPITVIRGYLDVLGDELEGQLAGDQKELMNRLVVSANRLSSYVKNILNTARYDRRHLKMILQEDTLSNVYDSIRDDMELRAVAQNRRLDVALPDTLPTVAVDRASIGEVLQNLIDNAIKYSYDGGVIAIRAELEGSVVRVSVADSGIGMPANVVSNLFNKFYRSHRSRESVAGTGIGLYISKAIVESHGGTIDVRSTEGQGSIFRFTIPVYASVAETLKTNSGSNESIINREEGKWIDNHSMFRG